MGVKSAPQGCLKGPAEFEPLGGARNSNNVKIRGVRGDVVKLTKSRN